MGVTPLYVQMDACGTHKTICSCTIILSTYVYVYCACMCVHVYLYVYVCTFKVLSVRFASSHFFHRPSLQYGHRHVEPWLHPSRTVHGIPTVPWGERGGAAGLHYGDVGIPQPFPSGRGTEKEALLWWVIRGDVGRKACGGKERVVEQVASICGFISVKELFYMPHGLWHREELSNEVYTASYQSAPRSLVLYVYGCDRMEGWYTYN